MPAPPFYLAKTDTFNRADGPLGNDWIAGFFTAFEIVSGKMKLVHNDNNGWKQAMFRDNVDENDVTQQADLYFSGLQGLSAVGGDFGVMLAVKRDTQESYELSISPYSTGKIQMYRFFGGVRVAQLFDAAWSTAFNTAHNYVIRAQRYGATGATPNTLRIQVFDVTAAGADPNPFKTAYRVADSAEVTDNTASLKASLGVAVSAWQIPVFVEFTRFDSHTAPKTHYGFSGTGDSMTTAVNGVTNAKRWFDRSIVKLGSDWDCDSSAVGGQTLTTMIANAATYGAARYKANYVVNVVVCQGGTNDIAQGATGQQTADRAEQLYAAYKAMGFLVIAVSIPPADGLNGTPSYGYPADFNAKKTVANNVIAASVAAGTSSADFFVDMRLDPYVGVDGAEHNLTYFQPDGVHWEDPGYDVVWPYFDGILDDMLDRVANDPLEAPTLSFTFVNGGVQVAVNPSRGGHTVSVMKDGVEIGTALTVTDSFVPDGSVQPVYSAQSFGTLQDSVIGTGTVFSNTGGEDSMASWIRSAQHDVGAAEVTYVDDNDHAAVCDALSSDIKRSITLIYTDNSEDTITLIPGVEYRYKAKAFRRSTSSTGDAGDLRIRLMFL